MRGELGLRAGRERAAASALAAGLLALAGCTALPPLEPDRGPSVGEAPRPPAPTTTARRASEILVCGRRFPVDAPVVLWTEPPFYDAHRPAPRFASAGSHEPRHEAREPSPALAARVAREGWSLDVLREAVDLFVLHYDACGSSRRCFEVLHDVRGLSVHFLLDVDGTIYQTLDLRHEAWHARQANPRSIGIEIAHVGAFPPDEAEERYAAHYGPPGTGRRLRLPADAGVRTTGFVGRPARPEPVRGTVQGRDLVQLDFTPEQYASLEALTEALLRAFPRLRLDVPRDASGAVRRDALTDRELERFAGIVAHWHVGSHKVDPGPAFDWERFLAGVRARVARRP